MITRFNTTTNPNVSSGANAQGMSANSILYIIGAIIVGYLIYTEIQREKEKEQAKSAADGEFNDSENQDIS